MTLDITSRVGLAKLADALLNFGDTTQYTHGAVTAALEHKYIIKPKRTRIIK